MHRKRHTRLDYTIEYKMIFNFKGHSLTGNICIIEFDLKCICDWICKKGLIHAIINI